MNRTPSARYCSKGEHCTQYATLGQPAKLSQYNEESICERCREQARNAELATSSGASDMAQVEDGDPYNNAEQEDTATSLSSSAERDIRKIKAELVLSLFTKHGSFWESVKELRELWGITPSIQVPPSKGEPIEPGVPACIPPSPWVPRDILGRYEEHSEEWAECLLGRSVDIHKLQKQTLPEKYHEKGAPGDWDRFLSGCVLYEPPETKLTEFAAFSDPEPQAFYGTRDPDDFLAGELPRMLAPPIKTLRELRQSEDWVWDCAMFVLGEQLKSLSLDPHILLAYLEREAPDLVERYRQQTEQDEARYYIEVDEHTTTQDVANALQMIGEIIGEDSGGAPHQDLLIAVQCAILHLRHNERDPEDQRRRRWSYEQLAAEYKLGSEDTAKYRVTTGRRILNDLGMKLGG